MTDERLERRTHILAYNPYFSNQEQGEQEFAYEILDARRQSAVSVFAF